MQIRWSPAAAADLSRIFEYIRQENPSAAERVVRTIYDSASSLVSFPNRGKAGRVEGTRELPLPSLPFLVVYRVLEHAVEIANVIHGAQRWPPTG
jgi:addiction module RelE/StbE family toxin